MAPASHAPGVFCAAVSHPADNLVSKLNAQKGATDGDIVKQVRAVAGQRHKPNANCHASLPTPPGIYDAFKVYSGLPTTGAAVKK